MIKVAAIIPSRGLIFSKTAAEIVNNLQGVPHERFFAHKLPIPDAFEWPTIKALKDPDITHLWFTEEDMVLPDDILRNMLYEEADVVTCDYPADNKGRGVVFKDNQDKVIFGGLGCTLVKRSVMDKLNQPYFRTDIRWHPANLGTSILFMASKRRLTGDEYGTQDVNFFMKLHKINATISLFPVILGQRKLLKLGEAGTNEGAHVIEEWTELNANYWNKEMAKLPKQVGSKLKTIKFKDGKTQNVSKQFAIKLVKEGKAKLLEPVGFIVDDNGIDL